MAQLKGVIFGWDNVLVAKGKIAPQVSTLNETGKLVRFLKDKGVEIVVATNHTWFITDASGKRTPAKDYFEEAWGVKIDMRVCGQGGGAGKQSVAGFQAILDAKKWKPNNAVLVGNSKADMQAAVNNKLLLLTARWYPDTEETTDYGFQFKQPKGIARFIDVFCLRDHYWYYKIEDGHVQVYALAKLGSRFAESKVYSDDFLKNVKDEMRRDEEFWAKFLGTSMYFSGVYENVNYITAYPKHTAGQWPGAVAGPMDTFGKCFRTGYIPDLIRRHTTAKKSKFNRQTVDHGTQLDTIHLTRRPFRIVKGEQKQYAKFPIDAGDTVLVIDDVCTKGMSFEAARQYLNGLGIRVVSVAFLKTPGYVYESIRSATLPRGAFGQNKATDIVMGKAYGFNEHVVDPDSIDDLTERLERYKTWDWPEE